MNWAIGDIYVQNFRYMDKIWIQATYRHFPFFKAAFYTVFRIIIVFVAHFEENNPKWMAFESFAVCGLLPYFGLFYHHMH
jgi:hypothetical protein